MLWVLRVSNDASEDSWEVGDRCDDNKDLNGRHVTDNFAVIAPPSGCSSFVHFRTWKNRRAHDQLRLSSLEAFLPGNTPQRRTNSQNFVTSRLSYSCRLRQKWKNFPRQRITFSLHRWRSGVLLMRK